MGPLHGIKVIEFEAIGPGPFCGMMLADMGADVIVIDRAGQADLGLNPQTDGDMIRVPIPPLTEERRKEMVKVARKYSEECKVSVRNARRDALEMLASLAKEGEASEDEVDRGKKKAEEIVSEGIKQTDGVVSHKEKDILDVG